MITPSKFLFLLGVLLMSCSNSSAPGEKTVKAISIQDSASINDLNDKYKLDKITLPPGFHISVYAEVSNARSMCLSPNGTLFVGTKESSKVYAVRDENHDGRADKIYTVASGLRSPNGVAFKDGSLYIATISTIVRVDNIEQRLGNPPKPVTVYDKYPTEGLHGWKFIAFGPDGKLYVPVGAPCNICQSANPVFASITRMNADGTGMEIYAKGIRNTVGFAWHPESKELWFTDNGGDGLGDNMPNDELDKAPRAGINFGYPYCHQGNYPDPNLGKGKRCADYAAPEILLGPHVAALGMRFYTGSMFPSEYRNAIFIAEHGSWNRTDPIGYRVAVIKQQGNGAYSSPEVFAQGWLSTNGNVSGRPVDVQQMPDGSLLVSDDYGGAIFRITYKKP